MLDNKKNHPRWQQNLQKFVPHTPRIYGDNNFVYYATFFKKKKQKT